MSQVLRWQTPCGPGAPSVFILYYCRVGIPMSLWELALPQGAVSESAEILELYMKWIFKYPHRQEYLKATEHNQCQISFTHNCEPEQTCSEY